ncbi:MAG: bacteriohemerythrin [Spirochaetia bacterium]|nr:bacteriohemerythrin [Spirochaetia bacterium]
MKLIWNEEFLTGIESIDEQHKRIFDLIERLENEIDKQCSTTEIPAEIIMELLDYTLKHFIFEESLLEQNDYPEFTDHKIAHDMLTMKVMQYKEDLDADKQIDCSELINFLYEWLTTHIKIVDMKYVSFIKEKVS